MKKLILISLIALTGCYRPINILDTEPSDLEKLVNNLQYFKSKDGLCFGVIVSSRQNSSTVNQNIVYIPCEAIPKSKLNGA